MTESITARVAALELLLEQLIVERCLSTDDPLGAIDQAEDRLVELARQDERVTPEVLEALAEALGRVAARVRDAEDR
ncbi:hypothetical protein [Azospirillum sp. TSO35-2]|uniref:hypothetical protein n=1 Tax=Azospirillum sp. TSO35-2 TaxID=716796 RepID=UPI000D622A1F|nr:hypothetical protein [Azospirillum sp. TSO35-2]PWC39525.1 hypothetical protein TSO352_05140 [Azospirillum sp. TSO35-2]